MLPLRPYQQDAVSAIEQQWYSGNRKTLLVLPTGCGKTIVFCTVAQHAVQQGKRVLILAHRGELLDQAADKLRKTTGLTAAVEKASASCMGKPDHVVVGSVQTLGQPKRLATFPTDYFNTIIIDEAHHCLTDTYQRVLEHFPDADILGVTATPDRGDQRELSEYFDSIAYQYDMRQAVADKYLCPIKAAMIPLKLDITSVGTQQGDFKLGEVGSALDPYLEQIATEMESACAGRKTVVFLPLIKTSQKMCSILNAHGFRAAEVNGNSEDRAEILADFDTGKYNVLCNSMLLTEGWDCPTVDCIVVLRPTKIRSLYCQMIGRGTRPASGKEYLLVLDFLWLIGKHDLCRPATLIARNAEVAAKMTASLEKSDGMIDLESAEAQAAENVQEEREAALAAELKRQRNSKAKLIDPLQYADAIGATDLFDYVPTFGWESRKPTQKQMDLLEHIGINPDGIQYQGEAAKLLDYYFERNGLATPKQIRTLERYGFRHVAYWTIQDASAIIGKLAAHNWKPLWGMNTASYMPAGVAERLERYCQEVNNEYDRNNI